MLTVIDEYTRECLAIQVARQIRSDDVVQLLADLFVLRGPPEHLRSDNGPEFCAQALREWTWNREVRMVKRKHSIEQIIGKLRETEVELAQGRSVAEVCRSLGVTEQTYYRWRKEYGGLKMDQAKRLKVLEQENTRLRRAVADLTLDKQILQEVTRGNG